MKPIRRRDFLQTLGAGAAVIAGGARIARAADSTAAIEVLLDEPIGVISPDLYGHFTEHIGGVIYDGIWVGEIQGPQRGWHPKRAPGAHAAAEAVRRALARRVFCR